MKKKEEIKRNASRCSALYKLILGASKILLKQDTRIRTLEGQVDTLREVVSNLIEKIPAKKKVKK